MDQEQKGHATCDVCHQTFNSERELKEHQKVAHQQGQSSDSMRDKQGRDKVA